MNWIIFLKMSVFDVCFSFPLQNHINSSVQAINAMLPGYLKSLNVETNPDTDIPIPDSTSSPIKSRTSVSCPSTPPRTCPSPLPSLNRRRSASLSPRRCSDEPDLHCSEDLSNDSDLIEDFENEEFCLSPISASAEKNGNSGSSSPVSAVDLFSEIDSNIFQAIFDQADSIDSGFSILVS